MQTTMSPSLNGTPTNRIQKNTGKKSKTSKAPTKITKTTADRIKFWATITMGMFMPVLSLILSYVGGNLLGKGSACPVWPVVPDDGLCAVRVPGTPGLGDWGHHTVAELGELATRHCIRLLLGAGGVVPCPGR